MKTTQVRLDTDTAKALREIAAAFEYYTERGFGAGEIGNIAAMLETLARRWKEDPAGTLVVLGQLVAQTGEW